MAEGPTALARHALGLDGRRKTSYRNYFVTGEGCADHVEWMRLVELGDAVRYANRPQFGGDDLFKLTRKGAAAVLRDGEALCPEDFPMTQADRDGLTKVLGDALAAQKQ